MNEPTYEQPLVWIDLEMTGLDPEHCAILEIATVLTEADLSRPLEGPELVIHHPEPVLAAMDAWCTEQHGQSGLTAAVRSSATSLAEAEQRTLAFLRPHAAAGAPLCGNSVGTDWCFLAAHMPELAGWLGGEIIDVSTVKELARRWYPALAPPVKKEGHRALDDILESIEELRHYRSHIFR